MHFDVELLGNCDTIISELCNKLGDHWQSIGLSAPLVQVQRDEMITPDGSSAEDAMISDSVKSGEDGGGSTAQASGCSNDVTVPCPAKPSAQSHLTIKTNQ